MLNDNPAQLTWTCAQVQIPPHADAQRSWSQRSSVRVGLTSSAADVNPTALGEITPLPGFSSESLTDCIEWLRAHTAFPLPVRLHDSPTQLLTELCPVLEGAPAAARFGVETAVLHWWANRRGQPLLTALQQTQPEATNSIGERQTFCPLLDLYRTDYRQAADELLEAGARRVKIKIGRDLEQELPRLKQLSAAPWLFRLDANQSLPADRVERVLSSLALLPVEYVEEPCPSSQLGPPRRLGVPIAFDESLRDVAAAGCIKDWLQHGQVRALVYKPMLHGALLQLLRWRRLAQQYGAQFVLSHLFDGGIAMQMYHVLSAWLEPQTSHGLAPHAALGLWSDTVRTPP